MKKKLLLFTCLFLLFIPLNLKAFFFCGERGHLEIEGEWLYLRPTKENYLFSAARGSGPFFYEPETVIPAYHSGWRAGASYHFCDSVNSFSVRGTRLKTTDHQTFTSRSFRTAYEGFSETDGIEALDHVHFDYYAIEFLLTHQLYCDYRFNIDLSAGVQYARISRKEIVSFQEIFIPFSLKHQAHFWGVGPELGVDFYYCLRSGFSLSGRGFGSLLVSRAKQDYYEEGIFPPFSTVQKTNGPVWKIIPAVDLRFGLRYDHGWSCLNLYVEAGYELISYIRGLPVLDMSPPSTGFNRYDHASMHGPYVALGIIL